jgi:hypothetical protein
MRSSARLDRRAFALAVTAPLVALVVGCEASGGAGPPSQEAKKAREDRLARAKAARPPSKSKTKPRP